MPSFEISADNITSLGRPSASTNLVRSNLRGKSKISQKVEICTNPSGKNIFFGRVQIRGGGGGGGGGIL